MKILQLTNKVPYPPKDGGSIATLNLSKSFAKMGHQVTILAMNTTKHFVNLKVASQELKQFGDISLIGININTEIHPLQALNNLIFSNKPYNAERFICKKYELALIHLLREKNFDIVQLEGLYVLPYAESIKKYANPLLAYRAHNIEHEIWERTEKQESNWWRKKYIHVLADRLRTMEKKYMDKYDVLLPITQRDEKILRELGNTCPVHVVPAGSDSRLLKPDNQQTEFPSLFHLGALDWGPNQEGLNWFLKYCWSQIHIHFPDVKFYIAGRNAPEKLIRRLKHWPNVKFCGEVESAADFMRSKAVMVVPLLSGSGMRVKIVEGLMLEKAIVSTPIGAEGIVNDTHKQKPLILAKTPEEFIQQIQLLLSHKNDYEKLTKQARKFAIQHFDNDNLSKSLLEFYNQQLEIKRQKEKEAEERLKEKK